MISFLIFAFGLAVGSFLNSVIFRMERGTNVLWGRSACPHCAHILAWQDLIPVLSFVFLRGRCRYCRQKISWQYPIVELATGILFLLILNFSSEGGKFFNLAYLWIISALLIAIFVYDLKQYIIPDRFLYPAVLGTGIWYFVFSEFPTYQILHTIYSALGAAAFFLTIYLVSRGRWMGFGDVKLAFFMGLFLGWPNILLALFFAFFMGAWSGIFLVLSKKKEWRSQVPFGPFLITGTFAALFWGERIIDWYLRLVLV